jgi:hypothetical protein
MGDIIKGVANTLARQKHKQKKEQNLTNHPEVPENFLIPIGRNGIYAGRSIFFL